MKTEDDDEIPGGDEAEDRGDPAGAYKAVMDNDGEVPLIQFGDKTEAEAEAEERAVEDYTRMEKEKEMDEEDD